MQRAAPLAGSVRDAGLELQYKTCYARILDSKRKFLEASTRYYELSQAPAELVSEADRGRALEAAAACAILAGAGPQRSRVLAMLCKDERASGIGTFSLLNKVFLDRLLSAADVEAFRATLAPHQLAITGDGTTVLDRAAAEHNLVAVRWVLGRAAEGRIVGGPRIRQQRCMFRAPPAQPTVRQHHL